MLPVYSVTHVPGCSAPLPPNGDGGSSAERHSRPPRERQPREELGSHGTARVLAAADIQSRSRSGVPLGRPRDHWQSTPLCQEDCRSIPTRRLRRCLGIQRRCAIRAPSRYAIRVICLTLRFNCRRINTASAASSLSSDCQLQPMVSLCARIQAAPPRDCSSDRRGRRCRKSSSLVTIPSP